MAREKAKAVSASVYGFPHLLLALRELEGDFANLFTGWLAWMAQYADSSAQDYYNNQFGLDFCQYLRDEIAAGRWPDAPYLMPLIC